MTSKAKGKQTRFTVAKNLLKKEASASKSASIKTKSKPLPKWLIGMIFAAGAITAAVILTVGITSGIRTNNDKEIFKSVRATVAQESKRLSANVMPVLDWGDTSYCNFILGEGNTNNLWDCNADNTSSITQSDESIVSYTQKLAKSFQAATDLFTFQDKRASDGFPSQVNSYNIVNAIDKTTQLNCSLAIEKTIKNIFSVDLSCRGGALQSWYKNNGLSNQTSPGSNAWKY